MCKPLEVALATEINRIDLERTAQEEQAMTGGKRFRAC
jgi:hypothetical protein